MLFYFWGGGEKKLLPIFIKVGCTLGAASTFNIFTSSQDLHFWNIFNNNYKTFFLEV